FFFFSSRRRHTRSKRDWSSDVCSSDLDYAAALSIAQQSKRAAAGEHVDVSIPVVAPPASSTPGGRPCPSCGASLAADDMFCRKCGKRVAASACGSCDASLRSEDAFCPKCGTPVPQ